MCKATRNLIVMLSMVCVLLLTACGSGASKSDDKATSEVDGDVNTSHIVSVVEGVGGSASQTSIVVDHNDSTSVTVTADNGYSIDGVSGCGGALLGDTYTTGRITDDCTIITSFQLGESSSHVVSVVVGVGGSANPTSIIVDHNGNTSITVTAGNGYSIDGVSGCGGALLGDTYTTGAITDDCTIIASFQLDESSSHVVSVVVGVGGSANPTSIVVDHNSNTNIAVTAEDGYSIYSVSGCDGALSGDTYTTGVITDDCTIISSFQLNNSGGSTGEVVVNVGIDSLSQSIQESVPVTFGQTFPKGAIPQGENLAMRLAGNLGTTLPSQVNTKATHVDGSLRHAIITTRVPTVLSGSVQDLELVTIDVPLDTTPLSLGDLLLTGFDGDITVTLDGEVYQASIKDLLLNGQPTTWLTGPMATEWIVSAPLKSIAGSEHPHLTAHFNVRAYSGFDSVRVDVIVENNWAYTDGPRNFIYDATVTLCGNNVYDVTELTHFHHARWRKTFWCGNEPLVHIRHDVDYLIDSYAVPNFDRSLIVPPTVLAEIKNNWVGVKTEPMGIGVAHHYMGSAGARPDIGPLPRWTTRYLLSQDHAAKKTMLGTDTLAGSWPIHYRDIETGHPISIDDYPYMTIMGGRSDTYNPATGLYEAFPSCGGSCGVPYAPDLSHQPSFAYLPYLVTGDYYFLEELQFWTSYNLFHANPGYRDHAKGLFKRVQVRGQAWSMRTLGQAAYITPDDHPLKGYLTSKLKENLTWYDERYVDGGNTNNLGVLTNGYAFAYNDGRGIAPWQDDFFTWSVGYLVELGFTEAQRLSAWKASFSVSRMTDDRFCWLFASAYSMNLRDSSSTPLYSNIGEVYGQLVNSDLFALECNSSEMATYRSRQVGEMSGYAYSATGFPADMQPALAVAADSNIANAKEAWAVFDTRTVKPDYAANPNFAVVPR